MDHIVRNISIPWDVIDNQGEVYIWGYNGNYVFGMQQTRDEPEMWTTFHKEYPNVIVKQIVLEKYHCVVVSTDGMVFSCGHGLGGRLGLRSEQTKLKLTQINFTDSHKPSASFCMSASIATDHSMFVLIVDGCIKVS